MIDQKDIDELLNSALNGGLESEDSNTGSKIKDDRVYRAPQIEARRITFPYKSPIIKSSKIIYNPRNENNVENSGEKIIVRSLDNYVENKIKREQIE